MSTQHGSVRYSVSVKGVLVRGGRVLLLMNERDEWELPGGRLEPDEQPETCVTREIAEETGWVAMAGPILDAWLFHVDAGPGVLIVTYGCAVRSHSAPVLSDEHQRIALFTEQEVPGLAMPDGYKRSIATWYGLLRSGRAGIDLGVALG